MTKKNSDNSDSCKPRRKPTVKQLRFAAAYVDPLGANGNGVVAARFAGYRGSARQLAVQAHSNLKNQTVQQTIAEMVEALVVPALQRVGEAMDAVTVRPFMTKSGEIVYTQPEPDHRTRLGAATFLFNVRAKCTAAPGITPLDQGGQGPTREEAIEAARECLAVLAPHLLVETQALAEEKQATEVAGNERR